LERFHLVWQFVVELLWYRSDISQTSRVLGEGISLFI